MTDSLVEYELEFPKVRAIRRNIERIRSDIEYYNRYIRRGSTDAEEVELYRESLKQRKISLTFCEEEIASFSKTHEMLRLSEVKKDLSHHKNVTNIALKRRGDGVVYLEVVCHNIKCTPNDRKDYLNLIDKSFKLPPVRIQIYLTSSDINFFPATPFKRIVEGYDGENTVHPHVLREDSGSSCLGDFLGNAIESKEDGDWDSLITILELFLEQAEGSDVAGQSWPNFMVRAALEAEDPSVELCNLRKKRLSSESTYRAYDIVCQTTEKNHHYWYKMPVIEGGRMTLFEGNKEDILIFLDNYIDI